MKKSIAIILVIFLFACKNEDKKTEALDFCMEQSENLISNQNKNIFRSLEGFAINYPADSAATFQFIKAKEAFKLYDDFEKKISDMELTKKNSMLDFKKEFTKYMDTLLIMSLDNDYFKSEIDFEKFRNLNINNTKVYSLLSTLLLNEFLNYVKKMANSVCELSVDVIDVRIVPTKDNYKIDDNLQVFFSEVYNRKRPELSFTQFTRNGIPLNIKDLNYDKDRRMINFKIKEKGIYKIKGYRIEYRYSDVDMDSITFPFETEYEVK